MRRKVEGVVYNTKTAIFLGKYDAGYPKSDIRWSITELYKTKSGEYFLHGAGGPASPYASCDKLGTYSDGEKLIPMSQEKVILWANEYLPDYELEKLYKSMFKEAKQHNLEVSPMIEETLKKIKMMKKEKKLAEAKGKYPKNSFPIDW